MPWSCVASLEGLPGVGYALHPKRRATRFDPSALSISMCMQVPAHVQKGYEKAQAAVALRAANESAVAAGKDADSELLAAYMAYTKGGGSPGRPSPRAGASHVFHNRAQRVVPV